jgi:hypothetical protein
LSQSRFRKFPIDHVARRRSVRLGNCSISTFQSDATPLCEDVLGLALAGKLAHGKDLIFHAVVKAFIFAAALREMRFGMDELNAILQQPHPELGILTSMAVTPGIAIVNEEGLRQTIDGKHLFQLGLGLCFPSHRTCPNATGLARMIINHRQGKELLAIAKGR